MDVINPESKKFDAIVCLSAIDWDFLWQRTQEIMSQFANMGYPVLFVENTGARRPGLRDAPRVWNRLKKGLSPTNNIEQIEKSSNIEIFSPMALPFPYMSMAIKFNTNLVIERVLEFGKKHDIPLNRILLWSYLTTPLAVELAQDLPWAAVVIDLVSDPCKVQGDKKFAVSHQRMLKLADVVLCASVPMKNTAKQQISGDSDKLLLFEDGFSTGLIDTVQYGLGEPSLLDQMEDTTMVAYIGGVNNKIWWDAVSVMVSEFPEINFVFAGPKDYNELPCHKASDNIYWIPSFKQYNELGNFLSKCKAGLIPYFPSPYVAEMRPAKINEYLVMGLPIVATKLPEIERFARENGSGIIYLAETVEGFAEALRQALDDDSKEYREKRQQIAKRRSWGYICKELDFTLHGLI